MGRRLTEIHKETNSLHLVGLGHSTDGVWCQRERDVGGNVLGYARKNGRAFVLIAGVDPALQAFILGKDQVPHALEPEGQIPRQELMGIGKIETL